MAVTVSCLDYARVDARCLYNSAGKLIGHKDT